MESVNELAETGLKPSIRKMLAVALDIPYFGGYNHSYGKKYNFY